MRSAIRCFGHLYTVLPRSVGIIRRISRWNVSIGLPEYLLRTYIFNLQQVAAYGGT